MSIKSYQTDILNNKKQQGFNTTNIEKEFLFLYGEVAEAFDAYKKDSDTLGEELADVAIYLLGLSEILNIDLDKEIQKKMETNKKRKYYINSNNYAEEEKTER
ncbi:MazG-like family protein [Vagococcus hydrophili]|uniref:NTP pyrophosphohydrolase MazG putative catalytic core domain-containing protein n=1 Tax=Vagococcus hydrophili TaxID=2714947 RepID=A0A6G8AW76_9ENTE|nr:MazG-like family protein [Vagococcus hydrophili]QIL49212.1 hypothetical protein G7082_12280 [Vagococcus hydrophili]